jgi:catechol 2,3-dioxygenase-like lactoylglutathione lyase family enzyme
MTIEHLALNVADPVKMADWYGRHLGMRVVRQVDGGPNTRFIVDRAGRVVLELYHQARAPIPDYAAMDVFTFHIAFQTDDVSATRQKLLTAGATAAGSAGAIVTADNGDVMCFLRDPWGVVIQLVRRGQTLL